MSVGASVVGAYVVGTGVGSVTGPDEGAAVVGASVVGEYVVGDGVSVGASVVGD